MPFDPKNQLLRLPHLDEIIEAYTGQPEDTYEALDQETAITTLKQNISDAIATLQAAHASDTELHAELDTLRTAMLNMVDDNIAESVTVNISAIATHLREAYHQAIIDDTENFVYMDPRCAGTGSYTANQDPENAPDDISLIICKSCTGYGYTKQNNAPTISWTITSS
jgi:hypothetical protein